MIIACIALGVALGGTSVAAVNALPRNSVGTTQLKKNAVTSVKIKRNAVTGAKVKNNAITGADVQRVEPRQGSSGRGPPIPRPRPPDATNATNAGNANTVGGATVRRFSVAVVNGGAQQTVLDLNGLIITLTCPGGATALRANNNSGGAAQLRYAGSR